jgi:hypothetical protein
MQMALNPLCAKQYANVRKTHWLSKSNFEHVVVNICRLCYVSCSLNATVLMVATRVYQLEPLRRCVCCLWLVLIHSCDFEYSPGKWTVERTETDVVAWTDFAVRMTRHRPSMDSRWETGIKQVNETYTAPSPYSMIPIRCPTHYFLLNEFHERQTMMSWRKMNISKSLISYSCNPSTFGVAGALPYLYDMNLTV